MFKRDTQAIQTKIDTLTTIFANINKGYYPLDHIKGKIPDEVLKLLTRHCDEWLLLLGYDKYTLNTLTAYATLEEELLVKELAVELNQWLKFQRFLSNEQLGKEYLTEHQIIPNQIVKKIHAIGWLLNRFDYGDMDEAEINALLDELDRSEDMNKLNG